MSCRFSDLKCKEVINIKDGTCLGFVDDIEIDKVSAQVISIIVYGKKRLWGLFGREEDIIIDWKYIDIIGEDTILVSFDNFHRPKHRKKFNFGVLFH